MPWGTATGSSSSVGLGLITAIRAYQGLPPLSWRDLAEEGYHIERELARHPGGKQDQYAAAHAGIIYNGTERTSR